MAHQVKARITKCGDGMEHAVPDAPQRPYWGTNRMAKRQAPIPSKVRVMRRIKRSRRMIPPIWGAPMDSCRRKRLASPIRFPGNLGQGYGHGNHTHTANLDQGQDHQLPKSVQPVAVSGRSAR